MTFFFDTGVRPSSGSTDLYKDQVWRNGTKQIPFDADAPKGSLVMFLCNDPNLISGKAPNVIVCEVSNTSLSSKYAYMMVPK